MAQISCPSHTVGFREKSEKMKIFSWVVLGLANGMESIEDRDAIIAEMEAEALDLSQYHDFDNTTSSDFEINYPKLVKEYFEGGANLVGGNVRGRSRAAAAAGMS